MTTFSPYQQYPAAAPEYQDGPPPVLLAVADPAPQRRLTVLFRLILFIPLVIALYCLLLAAAVVSFIGWWGALFTGRLPLWAGRFLSGFLRWSARVGAYGLLLTDAYPPFTFGDDLTYPVRLALPAPERLNRAAVFFRIILAIPAAIVTSALTYGSGTLIAIIAWLIALVGGRLPASLHKAFTAVVRYEMRYYAYSFMLTPAYPGGLFGDKPGIPAWADSPAVPTATGPGTDGSDLPGTDDPTAPAATTLANDGARPAFQPATWNLLLTPGAKKLVTTFIVLGAVLWASEIGWQISRAHSASNHVAASTASTAIARSGYSTLGSKLRSN